MGTRLLDRASTERGSTALELPRTPALPDAGYDAIKRLTRLRDALMEGAAVSTSRWKEPPLFFFDRARESQRLADLRASRPDPIFELSERIAAEIPLLCESVAVRRVARSIQGLRAAAAHLAPRSSVARDLRDLLAVPDDESILVLHPQSRTGFRLATRGAVDVGQFHVLMCAAIAADSSSGFPAGPAIPHRFVAACRNIGPAAPAGVPMVLEARFQFYKLEAVRTDGSLPAGFAGCDNWLWPASPLAAIPRCEGERVLMLGPPVSRTSWEVRARFPKLAAEVSVVEELGPFRVAEELSRFAGKPVAPKIRIERERIAARAA